MENKTEAQVIVGNLQNFNNGRGGKFLYVGASFPNINNITSLYQQGWIGTIVQHSGAKMKLLREGYGKDARIMLFECVITDTDGTATLYQSTDGMLTSLDVRAKKKFERDYPAIPVADITARTMSLRTLISTHGADVDLLLLDENAVSNVVLFGLVPTDFMHRLKCIFIRHENNPGFYMDRLKSFGFRTEILNDKNLIMVKNH